MSLILCDTRQDGRYRMDSDPTPCENYVIPLNPQRLSTGLQFLPQFQHQNSYKGPEQFRNPYKEQQFQNFQESNNSVPFPQMTQNQKSLHYSPLDNHYEEYSDGFYSPASSISGNNNNNYYNCPSICQSPVTNSICSSVSPSRSFSPQSPSSADSFEAFTYRLYDPDAKNSVSLNPPLKESSKTFQDFQQFQEHGSISPQNNPPEDGKSKELIPCPNIAPSVCSVEKKVVRDRNNDGSSASGSVDGKPESETEIKSVPVHRNKLESESAQVSPANKSNINKTSPSCNKKSKNRVGRSANPVVKKKRRLAANARERQRMYTLNGAFERLRSVLPTMSSNRQLSKYECLQMAQTYINALNELLVK